MESSQREEGPAPLLWRTSDFKQWAKLCSSEPEVGHALMRLVIGGRDIPHSCEVFLPNWIFFYLLVCMYLSVFHVSLVHILQLLI